MTRADSLSRINDHLVSALYHVFGLPVSAHQKCLEADLRNALGKWSTCIYEPRRGGPRRNDRHSQ